MRVAGARVVLDRTGAIERVEVRVAAGDPLDDVVLRSYCIGAAHMALGWVCSEGLAVDPDTGEVLDLTIRSFGVIRPARTPPIDVTIRRRSRPAAAARVGRGVRRRRRRNVERDHRLRRHPPRGLARPRAPLPPARPVRR